MQFQTPIKKEPGLDISCGWHMDGGLTAKEILRDFSSSEVEFWPYTQRRDYWSEPVWSNGGV